MTKENEAKKFLARVRKQVRKLKIHLRPMNFVIGTSRKVSCCALGAALALKAKTKKELLNLSSELGGDDRPNFVAKVLNGGTEVGDMFQLECGFEDWSFDGTDGLAKSDESHPFYLIGKKLREDADKAKAKRP